MEIVPDEHLIYILIVAVLSFSASFIIIFLDARKRKKKYLEMIGQEYDTAHSLAPEVSETAAADPYAQYSQYSGDSPYSPGQYSPYGGDANHSPYAYQQDPYSQPAYSGDRPQGDFYQQNYPSSYGQDYSQQYSQTVMMSEEKLEDKICPGCGSRVPGNENVCPFCNLIVE